MTDTLPTDLEGSPPPATSPGRKGKLYGAAVAELRRLISTGRMPPGHRLRERELCEALGISRTPLREAIRTLATEGLVVLLPNRSAEVADLDLGEVEQLYQVVGSLEELAAGLAMERITDAEIAEIGALHYRLVGHHLRGELDAYFDANQAIHRRIVEISGNDILLWTWDMLAVRASRARYLTNLKPDRWAEATREHEELFEAIRRRAADDVPRLLHRHIRNGLAAILDGAPIPPRTVAPQSASTAITRAGQPSASGNFKGSA